MPINLQGGGLSPLAPGLFVTIGIPWLWSIRKCGSIWHQIGTSGTSRMLWPQATTSCEEFSQQYAHRLFQEECCGLRPTNMEVFDKAIRERSHIAYSFVTIGILWR